LMLLCIRFEMPSGKEAVAETGMRNKLKQADKGVLVLLFRQDVW